MLQAYGVWAEKSMYGRKYMGVERTTVLIDRAGRVAQVWSKVKVPGHAEEVLEAARPSEAGATTGVFLFLNPNNVSSRRLSGCATCPSPPPAEPSDRVTGRTRRSPARSADRGCNRRRAAGRLGGGRDLVPVRERHAFGRAPRPPIC